MSFLQVFKEIEVAELHSLLEADRDHVHLIDIRNPAELARGKIPGAVNLPMHQLPLNFHKIEKDQLVVLYCRVGARSAQACAYLSANGFDNVHNLRGGIQAWQMSGLKVA